jgi:hypothetical protein
MKRRPGTPAFRPTGPHNLPSLGTPGILTTPPHSGLLSSSIPEHSIYKEEKKSPSIKQSACGGGWYLFIRP